MISNKILQQIFEFVNTKRAGATEINFAKLEPKR